jgi:hypothetical protein
MARASKFRTTIQPKVELGQMWKDRNGTVRRVVEPMSPWEVCFARVVDGYRTKVSRVSKDGAPSGGYIFVPKEEPQENPVHVRRAFGGERSDTFCDLLAEGLITTTMNNLSWWKRRVKTSKTLELCTICMKRVTDGIHAAIEMSETAEATT